VRRTLAVVLALALAACDGASSGGTQAQVEGSGGGTTASQPAGSLDTPGASGNTLSCWQSPPGTGEADVTFSDQTQAMGLVAPFTGMYGHAAVWGDLNGDGLQDLFMGTFADRDASEYQFRGAQGPSPDRLLLQTSAGFSLVDDFPVMFSRTSGGVVADLDTDGDLDLVLSRNFDDDSATAPPTQILRNDGGSFVIVPDPGLPTRIGGRSIGVFDYDLDGLLDMLIVEDRYVGGSSVLLHNLGGMGFEDVTAAAGIPADVFGLGISVADFSGDGLKDVFVSGSNRLFVATSPGSFTEADSTVFRWDYYGEEDDVAGSSAADINRDGLLDLVVGQHFNSTVDFGARVPVRLYLNRGNDASGMPMFEDVTDAAGLIGLPTKAPHVEINDIDNDGWPDIVTTASAAGGTRPAVFMSQGLSGDVPTFTTPDGLGHPQYWVAGPTADYDRDGRLDMFLVEWEPALPSLLLRNETSSGHWLEVAGDAEHSFGIGWRVDVYEGGGLGDPGSLLGAREITVTQGYSSGVAPVAHFGLGKVETVDVRITPPGGADPIELTDIAADQHITVPGGC
jgi:hypothetical protein